MVRPIHHKPFREYWLFRAGFLDHTCYEEYRQYDEVMPPMSEALFHRPPDFSNESNRCFYRETINETAGDEEVKTEDDYGIDKNRQQASGDKVHFCLKTITLGHDTCLVSHLPWWIF